LIKSGSIRGRFRKMATAADAAGRQGERQADEAIRAANSGPQMLLSSEELKEKTRAIRDDQIVVLKRKIRSWKQSMIDPAKYSYLEFVGFNPEIIRNAFIAMGIYHAMTIDQLIEDILIIIAMNFYMGNMLEKNRKRRSEKAKEAIAAMAAKYNLKYGATGTGIDQHTITVPRVSAAFPMLSVRLFHALRANNLLGMPFMSMKVPYCMRTATFCSFLPVQLNSRTREFLMKVVGCYSCDQSVIFSTDPKTRKPTLQAPDAYAKQWTYLQASAGSPAEDLFQAYPMLLEFEIPTSYEVFRPLVENFDKVVGLNDTIPTVQEYREDLEELRKACEAERLSKLAEEERIMTDALSRRGAPAPAPRRGGTRGRGGGPTSPSLGRGSQRGRGGPSMPMFHSGPPDLSFEAPTETTGEGFFGSTGAPTPKTGPSGGQGEGSLEESGYEGGYAQEGEEELYD
jgi:predicted GIY-YIG superfamily endonuclease